MTPHKIWFKSANSIWDYRGKRVWIICWSVLHLVCTHSVTVLLGKVCGGNTWWSSMLLHTTFLSDCTVLPAPFEPSDLQSDDDGDDDCGDGGDPAEEPVSSTSTNNCNRSEPIFSFMSHATRKAVQHEEECSGTAHGRRLIDTEPLCYKVIWKPKRKETFASILFGSSEPSSSISRHTLSLLGGFQSDRGALLCLPADSFMMPFPSRRCARFLQVC